jgi:8-amino-7-oxononanoate synthase
MKDAFSISSKINSTVSFKGKEYLYFSGTSYLGMNALPEFEEMVLEGIVQYGSNYGASRRSNVQLKVYEEMETFFASQAEAEKAVVMSSGFLAGYVTAEVLSGMVDEMWVAPDTHPAILPKGVRKDTSKDFGSFTRRCVAESHQFKGKTVAVFANALDPLTPAIHSYDWVRDLSEQNTYYLLLDDSHAFGLIGKGTFGTYSEWKNLPAQLIISGSLGKALGIPAGIILGPTSFMDNITSHPIFIGASPPAPGYCKAFLDAQQLYVTQQRKLQDNREFFFASIQNFKGLRYHVDFPVVTFNSTGWAEKLKEKQVLISSFCYPGPQDAPLDRIVLSAYHENEDLRELKNLIHTFMSHL